MPQEQFSDAIMLLKADHRKVDGLFEQFEKARDAARKQAIAHDICTELKIHTMIEEEIFYPAFREKIEEDTLDEAQVEHDGAKVLINDIESSDAGEPFFDAKVTVLAEEIRHHVHEEEMPSEGMFAQCRKTDVDLVALLQPMLERKQALLAQAKATGLPVAKPAAVKLVTS
jgi:hypothetical protein